ncbi:DUF5627 domain-containing protein [Leeuwenhoekiella palythoae]|uniref:DUF1735 domain-containing protein n=1 Tax=Leeuwenhoekiella palythoae TaxID=573501 RepID=A0A1M5YCK5_9FLAO|nr:DUF5627 domain-containing protein [Leeuwenhoekiella palythoae]RXG30647.1 putative protein DUF1735 [Leeuwenhoekiella palythoae]SHI09639.1 protein of unknown function [Leeuwenhoekiella palythoae]
MQTYKHTIMRIYFNLLLILLICCYSSCENGEWEFPDYEYQAVYFAYQYPVRTITLGEDIFDTTLDNQGKCEIRATVGGVYENQNDIAIGFQVDNSLVEGFLFGEGENPILPLPTTHYSLATDKIVIPAGELSGGVEVQLTDSFFNDPKALERNYVIPIRMLSATPVDSILSGEAQVTDPRRGNALDWAVQPKDFIFYAIKYINPWEGYYLRRGQDIITGRNGNSEADQTIIRRESNVIDDEVVMLDSKSRYQISFDTGIQNKEGVDLGISLLVTLQDDGTATISSPNPTEYSISGSGSFIKDGEKNSWGSQDRDALYLTYEVETEELSVSTKDTLVMRNRGVSLETFSPILQ